MYKSLPKFQKYDTIKEEKKLKIFSNFYLPVEILTETYIEQKEEMVSYSKEEATSILVKKIKEELNKEIGENKNIVNEQINETLNSNEEIEIEVIYEVLENIGVKQKIQ